MARSAAPAAGKAPLGFGGLWYAASGLGLTLLGMAMEMLPAANGGSERGISVRSPPPAVPSERDALFRGVGTYYCCACGDGREGGREEGREETRPVQWGMRRM